MTSRFIDRKIKARNDIRIMRKQSMNVKQPSVVIVGAGFAGINAAKELRAAPVTWKRIADPCP
jgi:NADH dehydrogenase FAD-containing subunit